CAYCRPRTVPTAAQTAMPRVRGRPATFARAAGPSDVLRPKDLWPDYDRWNEAIALELFLSGRSHGRPVYLGLEPDAFARVAERAGVTSASAEDEFVRVVRDTLNIPPAQGRVFERHSAMVEAWRGGGRKGSPPCVAVLVLLSLVAASMTRDERFQAGNYY